MDTPIRMPFMERRLDNLHIQKNPLPNGATAFLARSFVKIVAGLLVPVATDDVVCYGQVPGPSHAVTEKPPDTLYGQLHWVFNPKDALFIINITTGAGTIGQAGGAPQLSAVTVGAEYGILTTGTGIMMLAIDEVTAKFARVKAIYPNQALTDYNGLVLIQILDAVIQG